MVTKFVDYLLPLVKGHTSSEEITGLVVADQVVFRGEDYNKDWLTFKNCIFQDEVIFSELDFHSGIKFIDCIFEKTVSFSNFDVTGSRIAPVRHSYSIFFGQCIHRGAVFFREGKVLDNLVLSNCQFDLGLDFIKIEVPNGKLSVENSTIKSFCGFQLIEIGKQFDLKKNTFDCNFSIDDSKINNLLLASNEFKKRIEIENSMFSGSLLLIDGVYHKESRFFNNDIGGFLSLSGGEYRDNFFVTFRSRGTSPNTIKSFYIANCNFSNGFFADIDVKDTFELKPIVHSIRVNASPTLKGNIVFRNIDVGLLELSNFNANADFVFENMWFNKIEITNFLNRAQIVFSNVRASFTTWFVVHNAKVRSRRMIAVPIQIEQPKMLDLISEGEKLTMSSSEMFVHATNLGDTQFFQTDFASFDRVIITNSIVSEISTSKCKWFPNEKLGVLDIAKIKRKKGMTEETRLDFTLNNREVYRQLKLAMEKQGDRPLALEFQRREMWYYAQYITSAEKYNYKDRFILWLGQTNDYGQNWWKATWLSLISNFILYIPIALLTSTKLAHDKFATSLRDVRLSLSEIFYGRLYIYPQLLNPAHILDRIVDVRSSPGIIYFVDALNRIVIAYFIFQIVTAFRKYVRS